MLQDVAVVRRVRPDHPPEHEAADHVDRRVGEGESPPVAPVSTCVIVRRPSNWSRRHSAIERDDGRRPGSPRTIAQRTSMHRWRGGEPGVDGRRHLQPRRGGADQVGEHPDDHCGRRLGSAIAAAQLTSAGRPDRLIPDEGGVRAGQRGGDVDVRVTLRRRHLVARYTDMDGDDDIAVGDDPSAGRSPFG